MEGHNPDEPLALQSYSLLKESNAILSRNYTLLQENNKLLKDIFDMLRKISINTS